MNPYKVKEWTCLTSLIITDQRKGNSLLRKESPWLGAIRGFARSDIYTTWKKLVQQVLARRSHL